MDPHLNLFNSYAQGSIGDIYEERILEDNTTRALVVTLQILRDSNVALLNSFLRVILGLDLDAEQSLFDLQSLDDDDQLERVHAARQKVLLCISPRGKDPFKMESSDIPPEVLEWVEWLHEDVDEEDSHVQDTLEYLRDWIRHRMGKKKDSQDRVEYGPTESVLADTFKVLAEQPGFPLVSGDSKWLNEESYRDLVQLIMVSRPRPDGWIWDDAEQPEFAVLIETKIHGETYRGQLRRHIARWEGFNEKDFDGVTKKFVRWKDIYTFFRNAGVDQGEPVTRLVVNDLLNFLEENNMGDFPGFKDVDFKLEDRSKSWQKMESLGEYLKERFTQKGVIENFKPATDEDAVFAQQRVKNELKVYFGRGDIKNYCKYSFYFGRSGMAIDVAFPSLKEHHRKLVSLLLADLPSLHSILDRQRFAYDFSVFNKYTWLNKTMKYAPNNVQAFYKYCTFRTRFNEEEYYAIEHSYPFEAGASGLKESEPFIGYWLQHVLNEVQQLDNPFVTLSKSFPVKYGVLKGTSFKDVVWDTCWDLYPFYEFLNGLLDKTNQEVKR